MSNEQKIERIENRVTKANDLFEAGFSSKARQNEAKAYVSNAYDLVKDITHNAAIDLARKQTPGWDKDQETFQKYVDIVRLYDIPLSLAHVRPKHLDAIKGLVEYVDQILPTLIDLYNQIKEAPITPHVREISKTEEKRKVVLKSIIEIMEKRKAQYVEALEIGEQFGGLPVSINAHWVRGHKGTDFVRHFFYLRGKLTPLNIIIAAADELERRKEEGQ